MNTKQRIVVSLMMAMLMTMTFTQMVLAAPDITYINDFLSAARTVISGIFFVIVAGKAIAELVKGKMLSLICFALLAGVLGWFVVDPEGVITFIRNIIGLN